MKTKIALLSQFGKPIRGLSPYSDSLFTALNNLDEICVSQVDYKSAFPSFLHPAKIELVEDGGDLSWYNPFSWIRLANSEFDVIHIQHWLSPMSVYLLALTWLSKRKGKKVVITVHNPIAHELTYGFETLESLLYKNADALIVHTIKGAHLLRKRTENRVNISVIPLGIKFESFQTDNNIAPTAESVDLDPNYKYILIFGNLRGYKGVELLLDAWNEVVCDHPNVKLIIGGRLWSGQGLFSKLIASIMGTRKTSVTLSAKLNNLLEQNKIVYIPGFLTDEMIDTLIYISEFCVFPYEKFESQSAAACRAIGLGASVLVTDVGGLPDLASDESWIIAPGNLNQLINALKLKLKLKLNENNQKYKNKNINQKYLKMSWAEVAKSTNDVYKGLFNKQ